MNEQAFDLGLTIGQFVGPFLIPALIVALVVVAAVHGRKAVKVNDANRRRAELIRKAGSR